MSDSKPSTERSASPLPIESMIRRCTGWRGVCNPLGLGLLGLALAVALWGYGSRFWLYFAPSSNQPRVPVTRLWIEQRAGVVRIPGSATTPKLNPRVYADLGFLAPFASSSPAPYLHGFSGTQFLRDRWRSIPFFHTAIPLRSPPSAISL